MNATHRLADVALKALSDCPWGGDQVWLLLRFGEQHFAQDLVLLNG